MKQKEVAPWIQTYSGKAFIPQQPVVDAIELSDIAHSLAMQCRFIGHSKHFYSVAQHSILVSELVEKEHPEAALWGLMHDASEAYVSDLPRPIKQLLPDYQRIEDLVAAAICQRFKIPRSQPIDLLVKAADDQLLVTEARDLMAPPPRSWGLQATPLEQRIEAWPAARAEVLFLERFQALTQPL